MLQRHTKEKQRFAKKFIDHLIKALRDFCLRQKYFVASTIT